MGRQLFALRAVHKMENLISVYIIPFDVNMSTKKQCVNNPAYTYSGKESSPLGIGYTAEAEQVGSTKEGRDKSMWMVGIKNGVKVWNRIPTMEPNSCEVTPKKKTKTADDELVCPPAPKKKVAAKKLAMDSDTQSIIEVEREIVPVSSNNNTVQEPIVDNAAPKKKVAAKKIPVEVVDPVVVVEESPTLKKKAVTKKKTAVEPELEPNLLVEVDDVPKKKVIRKKMVA